MPALAIGAVVGAVASTAFTAATLSYVSIGLSVVGAVTKSKELSQIGAGIGLGSGISSLFSSATGAAGAAEAAGAAASEAGADSAFDSYVAKQAAEEAKLGVDAFGGTTPSFETSGLGGTDKATTGLIGAKPAQLAGTENIAGQINTGQAQVPQAGLQPVAPTQTAPAIAQPGVTAPPDTSSFGIKNWFNSLSDTQKNTVLQIGGKAAEGLFAGWSQEQRNALERERFNLENQKYQTQMANANAQPVISYKPVPIIGAMRGA